MALINYNAYADPNIWDAVNAYIEAFKQNPRVYPEDFGLGEQLENTSGFETIGGVPSAKIQNASAARSLTIAHAEGTLQRDDQGNILNAEQVIADGAAASTSLPANHPDFQLPSVSDVVNSRLPGAHGTGHLEPNEVGPTITPRETPPPPPTLSSPEQISPETILRSDGSVDPNGVRRELTAEDYGFEGGYTPPTDAELAARGGTPTPIGAEDVVEEAIEAVVALPDAQVNPEMEQINPYDSAKLTTTAVQRQVDTKHSIDFSSNINEIINFRRDRPPTSLFPNARSGLCRVRRQDGSTEYVPD